MEFKCTGKYLCYIGNAEKVETVFFGKGQTLPSFQMENGVIRKPYPEKWYGFNRMVWLTTEEIMERQKEEDKKKWWQIW